MNSWKEENYLYDPSYGSTVGNYLPDSEGPLSLCLRAVRHQEGLSLPLPFLFPADLLDSKSFCRAQISMTTSSHLPVGKLSRHGLGLSSACAY